MPKHGDMVLERPRYFRLVTVTCLRGAQYLYLLLGSDGLGGTILLPEVRQRKQRAGCLHNLLVRARWVRAGCLHGLLVRARWVTAGVIRSPIEPMRQ
jgi:hypothetical protein